MLLRTSLDGVCGAFIREPALESENLVGGRRRLVGHSFEIGAVQRSGSNKVAVARFRLGRHVGCVGYVDLEHVSLLPPLSYHASPPPTALRHFRPSRTGYEYVVRSGAAASRRSTSGLLYLACATARSTRWHRCHWPPRRHAATPPRRAPFGWPLAPAESR